MEKKEARRISFGQVLAAVRMEKGLGLDQVSDAIKVNYRVLQNIENDDHSKLPNDVYVKGFIRAYSDLLDLNRTEIIKLYEESYFQYQHALKVEADMVGYHSKFWLRLFMAFFVMILMIGLTIYFFPVDDHGQKNDAVAPQMNVIVEKKTAEEPLAVSKKNEAAGQKIEETEPVLEDPAVTPVEEGHLETETMDFDAAVAAANDVESIDKSVEEASDATADNKASPLSLKIKAVEETWIKIIVDKQKPKQFVLKAGDLKELKGENGFNVLIGNAGGVHVYLNDKPVEIDGKSGQVVTIQLP